MQERGEEREERWAVSLQPAYVQKSKKNVKEIGESYINSEGLDHYINRLRESYKESI